jgi:hypothetical protein
MRNRKRIHNFFHKGAKNGKMSIFCMVFVARFGDFELCDTYARAESTKHSLSCSAWKELSNAFFKYQFAPADLEKIVRMWKLHFCLLLSNWPRGDPWRSEKTFTMILQEFCCEVVIIIVRFALNRKSMQNHGKSFFTTPRVPPWSIWQK